MPSVLIVDNHVLLRTGLKQLLSQEYRSLVFGEAATSDTAMMMLAKRHWDFVTLELAIPGKDGFSVLQEIRRCHASTRVLVLSIHADSQYAIRAQQTGANGYVCKNAGRADLLRAVKSVLEGKDYFQNCHSFGRVAPTPPRHAGLSAREHTVMLTLASGKRVGEIAAKLNLSVKTISTYKRRVLDKLGLHSTADLVRYVVDQQLS